jgi:hypothetical protein
MDKTQALGELNNRMNILNSKKVPTMNKIDIRKGLSNLNHRKEIGRYRNEIDKQKNNCQLKINELNQSSRIMNMAMLESEPEIQLDSFKEPSMKKTRNQGRGYFW